MLKDYLKKTFGDAYTDEIDAEVGKELGADYIPKAVHREQLDKVKTLAEEIASRDAQLEELKKAAGASDELKAQIDAMQKENADMKADYEGKIADMQFSALLDAQIGAAAAKNGKAVRALLDMDSLKASKNQEQDIKAAIEAVKKENDFLFETGAPIKNPMTHANPNPPPGVDGDALYRKIAGLPPEDKAKGE
jgi:hypothetical protein